MYYRHQLWSRYNKSCVSLRAAVVAAKVLVGRAVIPVSGSIPLTAKEVKNPWEHFYATWSPTHIPFLSDSLVCKSQCNPFSPSKDCNWKLVLLVYDVFRPREVHNAQLRLEQVGSFLNKYRSMVLTQSITLINFDFYTTHEAWKDKSGRLLWAASEMYFLPYNKYVLETRTTQWAWTRPFHWVHYAYHTIGV